VAGHLPELLTDPDRLAAMSRAATAVVPLDADEKLAAMVLGAAR
jgi:UDP-N-acetylglucosamine--N-acetylmuramyl-(pentapeptide) pyrophosphoryl-undecaprenol N-acetylglucosamine transferase